MNETIITFEFGALKLMDFKEEDIFIIYEDYLNRIKQAKQEGFDKGYEKAFELITKGIIRLKKEHLED